jgi:hypothetical protein
MILYCLEEFKTAFEKLLSKNSYKNIEQETIKYFFGKSARELSSGTRLNHSDATPYIKKRLGGRGGYRFYYLLLIQNDALYLMFVHPKTGIYGAENITDESKAQLYKRVLDCIDRKDLYKLSIERKKSKIIFEKI